MARVRSVLDFFSKWKCSDLAVFDCVYLFSASLVLLQPSILIFPSTRGGLAQEQGKSKIGAASFTLCTLACFPLLLFALSRVFLFLLCLCIGLHTQMFYFWFLFVSLSFFANCCYSPPFFLPFLQIVVIDHFPCFLFLQIIVSVPFSENFANRPTRSPSPSPMCKLVHNITTPCVLFAHCLTKASQPSYLIFERRRCPTLIS